MTNQPLTDEEIDAFIESKMWVLRKGTDTARLAARIILKLYRDRRKLQAENAALKAAAGMEETKHTDRVTRGKRG